MQIRVDAISPYDVSKIVRNDSVAACAKSDLIKKNPEALQNVQITINKSDFAHLMKNRPLIRFRPLRNSFIKRGDKMLLATSLGISEAEVGATIDDIINTNFDITHFSYDNIEKIKSYVYRHGTKDQVLSFLENELSDVKTTLQKLYKTLDDNTGGLCEYYQRPCHMMNNETLEDIYNIVEGSLMNAQSAGTISQDDSACAAKWALKRIYEIQNDSRVIRAAKVVYNNG